MSIDTSREVILSLLFSNSIRMHPDQEALLQMMTQWLNPFGYAVIYLEIQNHSKRILRVYIDFLEGSSDERKSIQIEDCVQVTHILNPLLDSNPEVQTVLPHAYELEVSSPGIQRPLRTLQDFQTHMGHSIRVQVSRPLTGEELNHTLYQKNNPRQKNFLGTLMAVQEGVLTLALCSQQEQRAPLHLVHHKEQALEKAPQVTLPLSLISKANLEPLFHFKNNNESE